MLYLPMLSVAIFSVNDAERGFVWKGFTLKWYAKVFENERILAATWNTLLLAVVSTLIATLLGTMLALGLDRFPWRSGFRSGLELVMHLPVVTPDIILAAAMVVALFFLRQVSPIFEPNWWTFYFGEQRLVLPVNMILGHVTFQVPFVALVVRSRLATIGTTVDEAARDLYANSAYVMRRVTLPLLLPGVVSGAMLALTLSLDDFVISFFTSSPDTVTLPIYIYGELRKGITAVTHALSTLIFLFTMLLVIALQSLGRFIKE
ncbi:MAG: ABC transporter permease [Phycisphaerales bacterium]|nr:ABC transporter permease [Phycisphaerales bacterium]